MTIGQTRRFYRRNVCFKKYFIILNICLLFLLGLSVYFMMSWEASDPCLTPLANREKLAYMVKAFSEIMTELNVTHWIDYGTLLGALRYEHILMWDHDADVSFDRKFAYLLHNGGKAQKIAKERYNMLLNAAVLVYEGVQADVYSWDKISIDGGGFKYTKSVNRKFDLFEEYVNDFNASFIDKTVSVPFAGGYVSAPYPPMEFIKARYPKSYNKALPYKISCYFPWNIKHWLIDNRPIHKII
ncbi:hypothetical protein I4U23_017501 [Adineta vaga]|nr:hypothetical protein I4U23_017501 [Adineta vaga]